MNRTSSGTKAARRAANAGVQFTVAGSGGHFTAADFAAAFKRPGHAIFPPTSLVVVENTHNRGGGFVFPQSDASAICAGARACGIKSYLDGARALERRRREQPDRRAARGAVRPRVDLLVQGPRLPRRQRDGRAEGCHRARRARPGGCSAAPCARPASSPRRGFIALDHNVRRLSQDHTNARLIAERLAQVRGIDIDLAKVETNIVVFRLGAGAPDAATVVARAKEMGVLVLAFAARTVRAATHLDVTAADCDRAAEILAKAAALS